MRIPGRPKCEISVRLAAPDRGGIDDQIGVVHELRAVRMVELEAQRFQPLDFDRGDLVAATHAVAKRDQQPGDAAHAGTGDADEMHAEIATTEVFGEDLPIIHGGSLQSRPLRRCENVLGVHRDPRVKPARGTSEG